MNTNHNTPTTTTEELIVQYLDGELVRKELETVLFDRLSRSEEARMLLREYLVVRGAIRVSRSDKQFQLSDDLDERTRARILQIMEAMAAEELLAPAVALAEPMAKRGFMADRGAIASSPFSRQLKRWQIRGSLVALSLLLAIGTVWLVTGSTNNHDLTSVHPSQNPLVTPETPLAQAQPMKESGTSIVGMTMSTTPEAKMHSLTHSHSAKNAMVMASNHLQQNSMQSNDPKVENPASTTEPQDPDVMILPRYGKAIDAANKHEIVVSGKDRL